MSDEAHRVTIQQQRRSQTKRARMGWYAVCKTCKWEGGPLRGSAERAREDALKHERDPWWRVSPQHYTDGTWHIVKLFDGSWGIDLEVPGDFPRRYPTLASAKKFAWKTPPKLRKLYYCQHPSCILTFRTEEAATDHFDRAHANL